MPSIEADFLDPGTRSAGDVAAELAAYVGEARRSIDVAIYDFQARVGAAASVAQALEEAAGRGVTVRVVFNIPRSEHPAAPRPPHANPAEIEGLEVPTRGIHGMNSLMHHKYVVRDGTGVWTGSLNWTDDAFELEENVVLRIQSSEIAAAFNRDFEQLWSKGTVEGTGGETEPVRLGRVLVQAFFSPRSRSLSHVVAERLAHARHHVRILTPVMTAGAILGTLAEIAPRDAFDVAGAYDLTQMEQVNEQWAAKPTNRWKIEAWQVISKRLGGKRSTAYSPGAVHDYMHAKAVVADGTVLAGSYNCSKHGVQNAENLVMIQDGLLSERLVEFADRVAARYGAPAASAPLPAFEPG